MPDPCHVLPDSCLILVAPLPGAQADDFEALLGDLQREMSSSLRRTTLAFVSSTYNPGSPQAEVASTARFELEVRLMGGATQEVEIEAECHRASELERLVEALRRGAARRMAQAGLSRGWNAWVDDWGGKTRQRQLLLQAQGRLLRPKLAATYLEWWRSWQGAEADRTEASIESKRSQLERDCDAAAAQLRQAHLQLEHMKADAAAEQAEQARLRAQMEAQMESEAEKRVRHLQEVAARRISLNALSRGWNAWSEEREWRHRQKQLVAKAGGRLMRPKVAACFGVWHRDWAAAESEGTS